MSNIKISPGNSKLGSIPSVSLPAGITCRKDCECFKKCYAHKFEKMRPAVRNAYQTNYKILNASPDIYWREVEASIMMSRFFRYHVSGDIPDYEYFEHMIEIASRNPQCEMLCFTKKYDIVNKYLEEGNTIPKNLHMIFSAWVGMKMDNPFSIPEAHVRYKNGYTTAGANAKECGGSCTDCVLTEGGCWSLKYGEQVVFNEH